MSDQERIDEAVDEAGVTIAVVIDRMMEQLPAYRDLCLIVDDLVECIVSMSEHPEFVDILNKASAAR